MPMASALRLLPPSWCLLLAVLASACAAGAGGDADGLDAPDVPALFEVVDADAAPFVAGYVPCADDPQAEGPRPEVPRPDFCRPRWKNLNGAWRFAFDPGDQGLAEAWYRTPERLDRTITVPFPWQSELSGVAEPEVAGVAWYARDFALTEAWRGQRVHLVFGAVDWAADVWVNGEPVGGHDGGYTPFRLDVTDALRDGGNTVVVRAFDPGNDPEYPHGKQGFSWYTNAGGIWQTVWLEAVPEVHVREIRVLPPEGLGAPLQARLRVDLAGEVPDDVRVELAREGDDAPLPIVSSTLHRDADGASVELALRVGDDWLWSPETPNLVPLTMSVCPGPSSSDLARRSLGEGGCDLVDTYVGLRKVGRDEELGFNTNQVIRLNDRPVYVRGVLVQGWNPTGVMTYPDDAAIVADLEAARAAGFNLVRLHLKPEEPRVLYHADRLGLLIDDDAVNLGTFPFHAGDTAEGRDRWVRTFAEQVARDRNHPSILWWTLFNETWGLTEPGRPYDAERQAWVQRQVADAKARLPGALIEDMSPTEANHDHVVSDLVTWHFYRDDPADVAAHLDAVLANVYLGSSWLYTGGNTQKDTYPLLNTEFGPFSADLGASAIQRDRDVSDAFRWMVTLFRARPGISGYVFTELYDVEFERNGVLDYDRGAKQFGYEELMGCPMAALQQEVFLGLDEVPDLVTSPGQAVTLHPWLATYRPEGAPSAMSWSLWPSGGAASVGQGEVQIGQVGKGRTELAPLSVAIPGEGGVFVWRGKAGDACTYVPIFALPARVRGWKRTATDAWTYTLAPADLHVVPAAGGGVDPVTVDDTVEAAGLLGPGTLRASFELDPDLLAASAWTSVALELELAANQPGMPQTDVVPFPSAVRVTLGGVDLGTAHPADDWADARGVLSYHVLPRSGPNGGYGAWTSLDLTDQATLAELKAAAAQGPLTLELTVDGPGGAMVYGARVGRFGRDPRVIVTLDAVD